MLKQLVFTITGQDRPGIVEEITELLLQYGGNVEASKMARLGGEFASLMLVSVAADKLDALRQAVRELKQQDYEITTRITGGGHVSRYAGYVPYEIVVRGADHEGIIHRIARYLTEQGINIEDMDTGVTKAPMNGTPLFMMEAVVLVPPALSFADLREALDEIGDELNVDSDISPHMG